MITININGTDVEIEASMTPAMLLKERNIAKGSVRVNGDQLLGKYYHVYTFKEGDKVIILRMLGGG